MSCNKSCTFLVKSAMEHTEEPSRSEAEYAQTIAQE